MRRASSSPSRRSAPPITTAELTIRWVAALERRSDLAASAAEYLAPTTVAVLRRNVRCWLRFLEESLGGGDAQAAARRWPDPRRAVADFRQWAVTTRRPGTVNLLLHAVRGLYRWGAREVALDPQTRRRCARLAASADEVSAGPLPTEPAAADAAGRALPDLSETEFERLLGCVAGAGLRARRDRALLVLLRSCPVDSLALAQARVGDADLRHGTVRLCPRWRRSQWRRGQRATPLETFALPPAAQVLLRAYLEARDDGRVRSAPLFLSRHDGRGRGLSTLGMRLLTLRALIAAGLQHRAPGVDRLDRMRRYPQLDGDGADLALAAERLRDHPAASRARTLVLLHLLSVPQARVAWERLRLGDLDARLGRLRFRRGRGRAGGSMERELPLPATARTALRAWLQHRQGEPDTAPLFPDPRDGRPASHHVLKRWAWAVFPERLPTTAATGPGRSTSRLRRPGRLPADA